MKKLVILFLLITGFGTTSLAQERGERRLSPEKMTERMKSELDLTDEQFKPVYMANEKFIKNMEEAGGREAGAERMREIRAIYIRDLEAVLTDEQLTQVKEKHQERKERMRERRKMREKQQ